MHLGMTGRFTVAAGGHQESSEALGSYVTPLILGGGRHLMIGDLIAQQFGSGRNWPFGCAQAIILMLMVLVALTFYVRNSKGAKVQHG